MVPRSDFTRSEACPFLSRASLFGIQTEDARLDSARSILDGHAKGRAVPVELPLELLL